MTIKKAFASLTDGQRKKMMDAFNEMQPLIILIEDECFLSVHTKPEEDFTILEQSNYFLLGRFT